MKKTRKQAKLSLLLASFTINHEIKVLALVSELMKLKEQEEKKKQETKEEIKPEEEKPK